MNKPLIKQLETYISRIDGSKACIYVCYQRGVNHSDGVLVKGFGSNPKNAYDAFNKMRSV